MADLIDRRALVAEFLTYPMVLRHCGDFVAINLDAVLLEIRRAPTVDAVEVVRCKDCRWYKDVGTYYRLMDCTISTGLSEPDEDDYCSYGERREA